LHYHKSLLKRELKTVIRKHAINSVEKHKTHGEAQYEHKLTQRVKKFFAISMSRLNPVEESTTGKPHGSKLPQIRESDLVIALIKDSPNINNEHALCVVDSIQGEGNQIILKVVLRERQRQDERNWNVFNALAEGSGHWTLLKVCSLENFNRSYVGYDQF